MDRHNPDSANALLVGKMAIAAFFIPLACFPDGNTEQIRSEVSSPRPPKADSEKRVTKPAAVALPGSPPSSRGWTMFRGGPQRTGRAFIKGPRRARLKWKFATRGRIVADAAVASDNTVYVASHDGRLYAVESDGRERWSYDAGGKIWGAPAVATDGSIYFGSDADNLVSLDRMGTERWIYSTDQLPEDVGKLGAASGDVDTSPVIAADGNVIFGSGNFLYSVKPNGMLDWYFKTGAGRAKIFSSPALGRDGTVYFGTQGREFIALDQSAKVLWRIRTGGDNDGAPAVGDDGTIYFGSDDGKIRAVAPGGRLRWETSVKTQVRAPVSIGHDGTVFASTYGSKPYLAALDGATGTEKWRFHIEPGAGDLYGIQSGALVDSEGYVYFGGRDGYVYCLSPEGKLIWRYKTGDQVDAGPVIGPDGTLYIGSDDMLLYAFTSAD